MEEAAPSSASNGSAGSVNISELLKFMVARIVLEPEKVSISLVEERDANVYEIEVSESDLGKIIGKGGKTARSIRTLINAVAPRNGKRTIVEILE